MIIRRRVTRQFVQLSNDLVRDKRITLDEHGMLHYLLSLPNDWEVNLRQIEKFWSIGSRKRKRIFRGLRKAGWVRYERLLGEEGEFIGSRWIVCDEPGEPDQGFGDDEVTELDETDEDGDATKTDPDTGAASQIDHPDGSAPGAPRDGCKTHPVQNSTVLLRRPTSEEHRDSTNTAGDASRDDDDGEPPPPFGEVLKMWPIDNVTSAWACEKLFAAFTDKHKRDARDGVRPYLGDCRTKGQMRLCDLKTYLTERRWEKFTGRGIRAAPSLYVAKRGTPQAMRWREFFQRTEPRKLAIFDQLMMSSGGYTVSAEWPPPIAKDAPEALKSHPTRQETA